ncbi:MAG: diacylglycerol kinase family lipid kinase [Flavobacteriales bacterium]|nr:diacylglycerol kinase family lipid kinase [Flavobacteriales bacterium]
MKIAFILKGNIKDKEEIISEIRMHFSSSAAQIRETTYAGHAIELAKETALDGFEHIIATGGDGTLNEVVNGLMQSGKNDTVVIGQLAYGIANDFSRSGKYDIDTLALRNHIFQKRSRKIDVGIAEFTGIDKTPTSRYFINIADIGLGGYVVQKLNNSNKVLGTELTFLKIISETILTYTPSTTTLKSEYFNWKGKIYTIAVSNGKYFGNGLCISPKSELDSGQLGLTIVGNIGLRDYIKNLSDLKNGNMILHDEIIYQHVKEVSIDPISNKTPLDIDGEFVGYAPVKMKVLPGAVNFVGTR